MKKKSIPHRAMGVEDSRAFEDDRLEIQAFQQHPGCFNPEIAAIDTYVYLICRRCAGTGLVSAQVPSPLESASPSAPMSQEQDPCPGCESGVERCRDCRYVRPVNVEGRCFQCQTRADISLLILDDDGEFDRHNPPYLPEE